MNAYKKISVKTTGKEQNTITEKQLEETFGNEYMEIAFPIKVEAMTDTMREILDEVVSRNENFLDFDSVCPTLFVCFDLTEEEVYFRLEIEMYFDRDGDIHSEECEVEYVDVDEYHEKLYVQATGFHLLKNFQ